MISLVDELVLFLINEESGYFHQISGWNLNCAIAGAVLADLSITSRIDTDLASLFVVDSAETGDPVLDSALKEIREEPTQRNTQFWIERLSPRAESIIDTTLERLTERGIVTEHQGGFWPISRTTWHTQSYSSDGGDDTEFVKTRLSKVIFDNEIPDPRDILLISLIHTCDVFRFIFTLDEAAEERIVAISSMDVLGRAIAEAISQTLAGPALRRTIKTRPIPTVPIRDLLFSPHIRTGNISALFAGLAEKHGPVFKIKAPFMKEDMVILAGLEANKWTHRSGRNYLRAKDYLEGFVKVYGAGRLLPAMDGADHFRLRKTYGSMNSRKKLENRLDELYGPARGYLAGWQVGDVLTAVATFPELINSQFSPINIGIDTQDCIKEVIEFKKRALAIHLLRVLPEFMLYTPGMKRRKKHFARLVERVQAVHTPAQRAGCPRNLADDLLSLHASDPQFLPETDLPFAFVSSLLAAFYLGSALSFAVYAMVSQPALYRRIQAEAATFFANGEPVGEEVQEFNLDVTHRLIMECQRMYPVVPMQVRNVMNAFTLEGYSPPVGTRLFIAQTATHYMDDVFPDPFSFDIDRYLPERKEQVGHGYAPFGLGTHTCLGQNWVELQLALNLLLIAHYFNLELSPENYQLRLNPIPSLAPRKSLKFVVAEKRRELPA